MAGKKDITSQESPDPEGLEQTSESLGSSDQKQSDTDAQVMEFSS